MGNIIEFYGPPGTGKSVLTEASIDYLGDNNLKVTNREEAHYLGFKRWLFEKRNTTEYRLLQFILKIIPLKIEKSLIKKSPIFIDKSKYESELLNQFLIENPRLFCHISSAINNRCQDVNRKRWPKPIFKRLFVYQNMKEDIQDYTVVVDEGFCHRVILNSYSLIWGCNLPSDYREKIKKIARHIAKNIDYSFFISADPKICLKRHEKSGRSKEVYKKLEDSFVLKDFEKRLENSQLIHETFLKNGVKSFKIDNNDSLEDAKEQLYPCLDEIIKDLEDTYD